MRVGQPVFFLNQIVRIPHFFKNTEWSIKQVFVIYSSEKTFLVLLEVISGSMKFFIE